MEFCSEEAEGRAPWGAGQRERRHSGVSVCRSNKDWGFQGVIGEIPEKGKELIQGCQGSKCHPKDNGYILL